MPDQMKDDIRWSALPYAGENRPPGNAEEPAAGDWPLFILKRNLQGMIISPDGRKLDSTIRKPNQIDWIKELRIVEKTVENLDSGQKQIASYWSAGPPTKQWTPIADRLIDAYGVSAPRAARILAALHTSLNDALVVTWHYKYLYDTPRPNQLNPELKTYVCTPRHPGYPSGHAAAAGSAAVVLTYFFPAEAARLEELAKEAADSRLYAGVHFPADNEEGLKLGKKIGDIAAMHFGRQHDLDRYPVDMPYRMPARISLIPPPYDQALPFDFSKSCESLTIKSKPDGKKSQIQLTAPKLFI
ncbi:vanadium-dependent haloperoxidase [Bacillus marinisedimentorum]|uniref:vanadium-dependent haloperoxidase n=1 Tax=Bacillus marinisedimentorum TaxID=1821260 RepID=UPI0007E07FAD|nr:vanadium-dependent haloperoxidase [Bacillus marinisedimentorum]